MSADPPVSTVVADLFGVRGAGSAPGTLLGVWAHPDDESYLSSGLMAAAADAGARVVCATATRGERGGPDPAPSDELAGVRERELTAALAVLGVAEHVFLGYPDGGCDQVPLAEGARAVAAVIATVRPAVVVTFGPDGLTGHPDHQAVSAWTTSAFRAGAAPGARLLQVAVTPERLAAAAPIDALLNVYLPGAPRTVPPDALALSLRLSGALLDRKVEALRSHVSQTAEVIALLGRDRFASWVGDEDFVDVTGPDSTGSDHTERAASEFWITMGC